MNYPYIEYWGYKFSLIEPYTIDDKLIVDIKIESNRRFSINHPYTFHEITFKVRVHTGEYFSFVECENEYNSEYANEIVKRKLEEFVNYSNQRVRNESRLILLACHHNTLIEHLMYDVKKQCDRINRDYNYLSIYNTELRKQDRPLLNTNLDFSISNIERVTAHDMHGNEIYSFNPSPSSYLPSWMIEDTIHNYNYRPSYKKHGMPDENITPTTLLLGAEIEVDNGGKSKEHAKRVLEIMNGKDTWRTEENIFCVRDGSLKNGLEFPTQPGTLKWHKSLPYKEMFDYLDKNGYKAHDTTTCGLHVHINRSFFENKESECIGKLIYIVEKFNDEFSILGRRSCRHAKFFGYNGEKCKELYAKGYQTRDKYNAINLLHENTIEIRAFKGTLKYSTFINTLEFVSDLAWYVKNHTEEEIENMSWVDLYKTFSDELKQYYDEREKIESEKKKEKTAKGIILSGVEGTCVEEYTCETYLDGDGRIRNRSYNRGLRASTMIYDDIYVNASIMSRECMENVINQFNAIRIGYYDATPLIFVSSNESEETNEKKLKRLKKQLKTEQNYIAKKELNKQINKLQKEIKQEKKRKKQNTNN